MTELCLKNFQIEADKYKLSQVIRNFISNALKFTPFGGIVTVKASVATSSRANGPMSRFSINHNDMWLKFEVIDNGYGIAKVPAIFCLFVYLNKVD